MSEDVPPSLRCATCSKCCTRLPGQFMPEDLGPDVESRKAKTRELLATGNYSIDWWEGDPRDYTEDGDDIPEGDRRYKVNHLRPATLHGRDSIFDASWGGQCVFLEADGCSLPREDRPTVCKALVPAEDGDCSEGPGKLEVAMSWLDDHDWLEKLGDEMAGEQI